MSKAGILFEGVGGSVMVPLVREEKGQEGGILVCGSALMGSRDFLFLMALGVCGPRERGSLGG